MSEKKNFMDEMQNNLLLFSDEFAFQVQIRDELHHIEWNRSLQLVINAMLTASIEFSGQ